MILLEILEQLPVVAAGLEVLLNLFLADDVHDLLARLLQLLQLLHDLLPLVDQTLRRLLVRVQLAVDVDGEVDHVGAVEQVELALHELLLIVDLFEADNSVTTTSGTGSDTLTPLLDKNSSNGKTRWRSKKRPKRDVKSHSAMFNADTRSMRFSMRCRCGRVGDVSRLRTGAALIMHCGARESRWCRFDRIARPLPGGNVILIALLQRNSPRNAIGMSRVGVRESGRCKCVRSFDRVCKCCLFGQF